MSGEEILRQIEEADRSDINYFEILGTDRFEDSQKSFPPEYFEYRKAWSSRLFQNHPADFPLHVDIESTSRCNLRCSMCQIDFDSINSIDMDMELYKRIMVEAGENRLPSIKLNYRGEPTINKNLVEMVHIAKEAGIIEVQFNTNGVALNEKLSSGLIEAGLDRIKFSIDGATPEVYETLRFTKYDRVVNNVKEFVRIRNEKGRIRPIVHVQMVYMQDNKDEVIKYVQLWQNTVNRIGFSRYRSTGRKLEDKRRVEPVPATTIPCSQLWQRLLVSSEGQVLMCCGDHQALNPLGHIKNSTLKELWHCDLLKKYRRLHLEDRSGEIAACSICEINRTDEKKAKVIWEKIKKNVNIQV